jgi:hypothetical protein
VRAQGVVAPTQPYRVYILASEVPQYHPTIAYAAAATNNTNSKQITSTDGLQYNIDFTSPPFGASYLHLDSGFITTLNIGDFVWLDSNGDGLQSPGENGISGVTITIVAASAQSTILATTITDSTGHYLFGTGLNQNTQYILYVCM